MLFNGSRGKSLISEEFNDLCTELRVEARVSVYSNPGSGLPMRLIHFKNFDNEIITVTQQNKKQTVSRIPQHGELSIMLSPDEPMPLLRKGL